MNLNFRYRIAQLCGRGKYWRIWRIDCHSPIFYLPVFSYQLSIFTLKIQIRQIFPHQSLEISLFANIFPTAQLYYTVFKYALHYNERTNEYNYSLAQRMKNVLSFKVFSGRIGRKRMLLLSKM